MKYYYLLTCLLISCCVFAQTDGVRFATLRGNVHVEGDTGVAHVTVRIKNTSIATLSDARGHFELKNVPYGHQEISITSVEIQPKSVKLHVHKPVHTMPVLVNKAIFDLAEVQVKHKTEKKEIETQGFAVNVIETKEVANRNFQTNELLDRTVGVRVRQNGGLGSSVSYNLNGMSGESVRIFIDGIPISTYGASFSLNSIPPALIERIEVYKGVIPAHLSDDALGGAINVILKKGMGNNLTASVSYGSFNTLQATISGTHRNAKSGFTVKASGFYNHSDNDYEVWGKFVRNILPNGRYDYVRARRFNDAYKSIGGQVEVGFTDVKWADQFFVGYNGSSDYKEIQHGTYMSIPYKGRFTESESHVLSLNYRKKNLLVDGLEFTLSGMSSNRSQVVVDTVKWNYNWFGERSVGLDGNPILRPSGAQQGAPTINHINRHVTTFRAGINYDFHQNHRLVLNHIFYNIDRDQQDFLRSESEREFIGTRNLAKNITSVAYELKAFESKLKANVFGKYYQQQIDKMDPVLVVTEGQSSRRENRTANAKTTTGYGAALSYALLPNLYVLTSAEKAVRLPSEGEVFGSPGENIVENFGIRPEVSNNLNVGFRAGSYTTGQHKYSFALSGFIRDTRDKIVQRVNPRLNDAVQTDPFENLGKTKSIGFEAEASYSYKNNLTIGLSASKFNSVFNMRYDPNGREYDYYNRQLPNEPFFTINNTIQYSFKDVLAQQSRLNVYYGFRFVERFYTTWLVIDDFRTPRQYIQDLGASYVLPNKRFIVSADIKNIFDQQAYDNFAVQKPGRAFYLKLNYSINNL
ncbi:TonB-dependent receptor [Spirosoma sp. RP8]|uniref:TonB-dependent receptor n=1 Tax=Spirosoma liriopis TaxID=2937440 RepID=A0ABT0HUD1_9BACT|nr:TonB-dependent receptor plug domain-containing protein [Spirosoma liriopis]MCK8495794.1 TonB-dependent receptor [Spirosoma liriopis]